MFVGGHCDEALLLLQQEHGEDNQQEPRWEPEWEEVEDVPH